MERSFMLVAVFLLCCLASSSLAGSETDYGIMIDAGSSGSRIYLYEWPHRESDTLPLVEPSSINQTVVSKKINVPLASFDGNPTIAGESLTPLIDYIKANLPQSEWSITPIYLKATAGMRAISQESQDQIIADVNQYLSSTPFKFNSSSYAKVIPGTDEGVFGWITVNYALKLLALTNPTTFGALDMGGASTQITFNPASAPTSNDFNLKLAGNNYDLYVYSYPLGQDQANRLLLAGLLADGEVDASGNIVNPCYLAGYNESYTTSTGSTILAQGTSDFSACQAAVRKYIVTTDSSCTSCGIGSVYQPSVFGSYYAFSGFAYTNAFLGLTSAATISDLQSAGQGYCQKSIQQAQSQYTDALTYLRLYCFTSVYLSEVLLKYGFSATSTSIITQVAIGNIELTWALGGMIYEANLLPFGPLPVDSSAPSIAVSIFGVLLASLLCL